MLQLYLPLLENLFDSESWQTRAHRYGLCQHSGYMTLRNLSRFLWTWFLMDRICFYLWGTFCAYRVLWMCWQGTLLSKGTCRNFEEIPLTWLLTIRKSLSSARQVQALGGAFGVKYPLQLQSKPPVITVCYSMINSMFMSETVSHSCCGAGRCDSWQFHFAISQDQNCEMGDV